MIGDNHEDNLQQQLLSARYSLIQEISSVTDLIHKQKKLAKVNQQRLKKMKKKVFSLEALDHKVKKEIGSMRLNLTKLEQSQIFAGYLALLKIGNQRYQHRQHQSRRISCRQIRQSKYTGLQNSKSNQKNMKIAKVTKYKQQMLTNRQNYLQNILESERRALQQTRSVRDDQIRIKQRLKRYEEFKINQGKINYQNKIEKQLNDQKQKERALRELQKKVQKQRYIYKKAYYLQSQVDRIELTYLTGIK